MGGGKSQSGNQIMANGVPIGLIAQPMYGPPMYGPPMYGPMGGKGGNPYGPPMYGPPMRMPVIF